MSKEQRESRRAARPIWRVQACRAVVLAVLLIPVPAFAQLAPRLDLGGNVTTGSESERYLRMLQLSGATPAVPWTILPFSPAQAARLAPAAEHPWQARFASDSGTQTRGRFGLLRSSVRLIANTSHPFQAADGPTWSGRGLTAEIQGGFTATWSRVRLQVAPVAFFAQNADFSLAPNGLTGDGRFRDARFPGTIDLPQRFGDASYHRIDPGASSLSIDLRPVALGISTAPQRWGPARDYPLVLGPNAGGFPHVYAGSLEPWNLWLFRLNTRVILGQLQQSNVPPNGVSSTKRQAVAIALSLLPRGTTGLEVGLTRFFESPWTGTPGLDEVGRLFSGFSTYGSEGLNAGAANQLASAFFRWALPSAGAEFYGEIYREDYTHSVRRFLEKPDDLASYTVGFQRVFNASAAKRRMLRVEVVNGELSHIERGQRGAATPIPPYLHTSTLQGHTQNGMLLGSPEAYGGAGWRVGVDEYTPAGRMSLSLERSMRFDWLPGEPAPQTDVHPDVIYALRFDALRFRGTREFGLTLIPSIDLNRNLERGNDAFNLTVAFSAR